MYELKYVKSRISTAGATYVLVRRRMDARIVQCDQMPEPCTRSEVDDCGRIFSLGEPEQLRRQ